MRLCLPILEVLSHRGVKDPEHFLRQPTWQDLPSAFSIAGVSDGVARLRRAIEERERVVIFGDYDCDGTLAAVILRSTMRRLGHDARIYLPHRDEGYGFNSEAVHRFSRERMHLVITADNGINAEESVRLARRLGVDLLVVDHHQVESRSDALAVWSQDYSASGLALTLSWGLFESHGISGDSAQGFLSSLSRLAAIAAIADCVPLVGATRILTQLGLEALRHTRHPGLVKLLELSGCSRIFAPSSEQIAFRLAPRINAAGRVGHPAQVVEMLDAPTPEVAVSKAVELNHLNQERRRLEKEALEELFRSAGGSCGSCVVVYGEGWKKGIAGILASRARERYGVPAFVLVRDERTGLAVGSGRSVEGLNLVDALRACAPVLHRYGGHSQAAGVTLKVENIPLFRRSLQEHFVTNPPPPSAELRAEAVLNLADLTRAFYEQLRSWEPFGIGNPAPIFAIPNATLDVAAGESVMIRQGTRGLKARCQVNQRNGGVGEALVSMTATSATLLGFAGA